MDCSSITFSGHAVKRMFQRSLTVVDIEAVVRGGIVIEDYPTDVPYPSCLLFATIVSTPLHAVVARTQAKGDCIVVTVYVPDPKRWTADFKTRSKL
jgi:Domain of unknown function (DUF4258)